MLSQRCISSLDTGNTSYEQSVNKKLSYRREAARRSILLEITLGHSGLFEITPLSRVSKLRFVLLCNDVSVLYCF